MDLTYSLPDLLQTAKTFWKIVGDRQVIAFYGKMGSGKTTFIHALCDARHVTDTVGSPTFSIINEYLFLDAGRQRKIFHIDVYRVADEHEALQAGVEDCLYSGDICLVEWPERIPTLLPPGTLRVFIEAINDDTRKLTIGDN